MREGAAIAPRDRLRAALPHLVVFAIGLFLYDWADRFEFEQVSGRIGPGAWPKLILLLLLASALWGIVANAWRAGRPLASAASEADEADEALVRGPEIHPWRVWLAVAVTLGYLLLMPVVGFFVATVVFSFLLILLGDYRRYAPAAGVSAAIAVMFLFLFTRVVYVALPVGIAPFDHLSYALIASMGVH